MKKLTLILLMFLTASQIYAQNTVEGTVTDARTGELMVGVAVSIKGTTSGTFTGADGRYRIASGQLTASSVIVFSYIGYTTVEETPGSRTVIDVKLSIAQTNLDEVVVIGYGTTKSVMFLEQLLLLIPRI